MKGPLTGIRVVEFASYVAAPAASRVLADLGAEVLKVESFSGDAFRTNAPVYRMPAESDLDDPCFDTVAVNKQFIALDVRKEEGKAVFDRMLESADVFVTNIREDSLGRLGYSYEQMKERFPRIVYAHMLGYGDKGSKRNSPGFDYTAFSARGGVTCSLYELGGAPMVPGPAFGDFQASMVLVAGILAAIQGRHTTGKGDKVTASLHGTAVYMLSLLHNAAQYGYLYPTSRKIMLNPFNNTYKSKDDVWIQLCVPDYNGDYNRFVKVIGRPDLVDDPRFCDVTRIVDEGYLEEFIAIIDEQLVQYTYEEMSALFDENDIAFDRCLTSPEIVQDQECWDNGFIRKVTYPTGVERTVFNNPIRLDSLGMPPYVPSRGVGADTNKILENLGYSPEEIAKLQENGVALQHA